VAKAVKDQLVLFNIIVRNDFEQASQQVVAISFVELLSAIKESALFLIVVVHEHGQNLDFFLGDDLSLIHVGKLGSDLFQLHRRCGSTSSVFAVGEVTAVHQHAVNVLSRLLFH
jgi:hypothetical protein